MRQRPLVPDDAPETSDASEGAGTPDFPQTLPAAEATAADFPIAAALAAIVIVGAGATATFGEPRDWRAFFAAGTLFPLLVVLLNAPRSLGTLRLRLAGVGIAISAVVAAFLIVRHGRLLVLVSTGAFVLLVRRTPAQRKLDARSMVALLVAWAGAFTAIWWYGPLPLFSPADCVVAIAATALAALLVRELPRRQTGAALAVSRAVACAAPIVFLCAALRTDRLHSAGAAHHWSFIAGPAELIRQGGWLLWSVPSQYGFLNTLTLLAIPAPNRWQALFVLNAALLTASAMLCFYLLQRLRPDAAGRLVSLVVAGTAVFLIAGNAEQFSGPMEFPSTGAFRFLWAYAIVAVVLRHALAETAEARRTLVLGAIVWTVGSLWSFESFAYVSAAWVPAAVLLCLSQRRSDHRGDVVRSLLPAMLGPALLAAFVALLELFYRARLHHPPDYRSYWEFSSAYSTSYGTLPAQLLHPWIALALVLVTGAAVAAPLIRRRDFASLGGVAAAWGVMWSTASYYVARSHPNNATNLLPIAITCMAALMLIARKRLSDQAADTMTAGAALISIVLIVFFGELPNALDAALQSGSWTNDVAAGMPAADESLSRLLARNEVRDGDPVAFLAFTGAPFVRVDGYVVSRPSLIPAIPSILIDALPPERRREYLDRFLERAPAPRAFLVRRRGRSDSRFGLYGRTLEMIAEQDRVVVGEILRYYRVAGVDQEREWEIVRLQPREHVEPLETVLRSVDADLTRITPSEQQ
jgi:hypothetical protein